MLMLWPKVAALGKKPTSVQPAGRPVPALYCACAALKASLRYGAWTFQEIAQRLLPGDGPAHG